MSILKECKGALLPGTMTLLVAPPGHGKTSFLKALSGRLPAGSLSGRCGARLGCCGAFAAPLRRQRPLALTRLRPPPAVPQHYV